MVKKLLFVFGLMLLPFFIQAQQMHSQSKKAIKYFNQALNESELGNLIEAELILIKAIKADENFLEAYMLTGDIKAQLGYNAGAIDFYKKGLSKHPNSYPNGYYFLAKIQLEEGLYEDALASFEHFLSFENLRPVLKEDAEFQKSCCLFAIEAVKNPVQFKLTNLGSNINSKTSEYFPTLTVDNSTLLYTRRLVREGNGEQEDFMQAISLNDSLWSPSQFLYQLNTPFNEGAASISADGKTIVFTACEIYGDYGAGRTGYGSCDLFFTRRKGDSWSKPINMGEPINSGNWESQPSLSSDGKSLYFIRAPKKAQGNSDIYRSDLDADGYWQTPVKLNDNINTNKDEQSVFIHPDNQTLYFSSNGHIGMGKTDLFMSKYNESTQDWGVAINLGYPINTYQNENSILVAPDGKLAYFASERQGGFGELDLYSFQLPETAKPEKITYLKGVVYDAQSQELLSAKFELLDLNSGKQLNYSISDPSDGSFLLTINTKRNYVLNVSKPGYLFYSDQFLIHESYNYTKPFKKNIPLEPIALGKSVVLKNIFFETDKADLKTTSAIELNKLIVFLENNADVHIQILGHTDNIGSANYNQSLSTSRAQNVYNYLINHNINAERLSFQGFGQNKPIADNNSEEGRAQNRRTEFIVTKI